MTREPKERDGISEHRTYFKWHKCCSCASEFRRERGWKIKSYVDSGSIYLGSWSVDHYVCATCAPERSDARAVSKAKPWIPPMPKVAPAGPPKVMLC